MDNFYGYSSIDSCSQALKNLYEKKQRIEEEIKTLRELNKKYEENVKPNANYALAKIGSVVQADVKEAQELLEDSYISDVVNTNITFLKGHGNILIDHTEDTTKVMKEFSEIVENNVKKIKSLITEYEVRKNAVMHDIQTANWAYNCFLNKMKEG